ncbi:hypothetical protein EPA93_32230 [Ktedonosporobacter rubrisoli]|uniref:Novel STAND NTPase 2 domain-containing protein n=1 Tax=Ktedonosporobacter rubrisoli TaxID=2509675 RepID=A0A4P6JY79_KTERU|nr:AAA-like domain-containing protein [Ktedonosporobacter rubrisoli]QBD80390.1 hypothetical protein EPA93_32230 [Ktedonosporobacter rubrisoli]
METDPFNPYYDLAAVRDPKMFFGRSHLLRRLYSATTNRQSVSLVGPRHIGKSSVLKCMQVPEIYARFGYDLSHTLLVLLDLREYLQKNCDDFFNAVSKQVVIQAHKQLPLSLEGIGGEDEFVLLLDQIQERGFHLVLLMDAFDNIIRNKEFNLEFFAFLRALATMGKVSYVTASLAPLYEVCHSAIEGSPFFNIFSTFSLESLLEDEARDLITQPARRAGLSFSQEEVDWILKQAGRHPFFIQRMCHFLFEEKCLYSSEKVDLHRARSQAYNDLQPHFEYTWERLSEQQHELLKNEARLAENTRRELPELSESALFRKFVRDKYRIHLFHMTVEEVEKVLENLDDARALGESDLRHMNVVSSRLNRPDAARIEKGMALREALYEAFERLRGNGTRRDTAPEWKLYNILYYRYFKNHLKNEQIAARLEFSSTRQYFRDRNKALDALFNVLMEMEAVAYGRNDEQSI